MAFCERINVFTVELFRQYSSRRIPLWSQKIVDKTLPADGFSLNFHSAVSQLFSMSRMRFCIPLSNNAAMSHH